MLNFAGALRSAWCPEQATLVTYVALVSIGDEGEIPGLGEKNAPQAQRGSEKVLIQQTRLQSSWQLCNSFSPETALLGETKSLLWTRVTDI